MTKRTEPNYQLVARELRSRILQGEFDDGRALPTEADLSATYGVSRQTIRRAFQDLVSDSLVYRVAGRGTFAKTGGSGYTPQVSSIDDLMGLTKDTTMEVIKPLIRRVDLTSASRLRQSTDAVYTLEFVRVHDGDRFCLTKVFLPVAVGKHLLNIDELRADGIGRSITIIGLLDIRLPSPIAEAQQSITVECLSEPDATALGCAPGHAVLRIDRLYLDTTGQCVELATSYFLPELYSYRISLSRNAQIVSFDRVE